MANPITLESFPWDVTDQIPNENYASESYASSAFEQAKNNSSRMKITLLYFWSKFYYGKNFPENAKVPEIEEFYLLNKSAIDAAIEFAKNQSQLGDHGYLGDDEFI
jgi:hypothetical protein